MDELRRKLKEANLAVVDAHRQIKDLTTKHEGLERDLPGLRSMVDEAQRNATLFLDRFVIGKASQGDVDRARDKVARAKQAMTNAAEMIDAITRALKRIQESIPALNQKALQARRMVWRKIYDDLKQQIQKSLPEDIILEAYAAKMQDGGMVLAQLGTFPLDLFDNPREKFLPEAVQAKVKALADQYKISDGS